MLPPLCQGRGCSLRRDAERNIFHAKWQRYSAFTSDTRLPCCRRAAEFTDRCGWLQPFARTLLAPTGGSTSGGFLCSSSGLTIAHLSNMPNARPTHGLDRLVFVLPRPDVKPAQRLDRSIGKRCATGLWRERAELQRAGLPLRHSATGAVAVT